jgi:hypothetical protein
MKPRLQYRLGYWWCGNPSLPRAYWACALTPKDAFYLWEQCNA